MPARAQEEPQVLVLIAPEESLAGAIETALEPWAIRVEAAPGPVPSPTMPGSADRARALSSETGAAAVVWVSTSDEGPALWMYDRGSDRVVVRRLPSPPPFDPPTAAAVALSVKTLLRHSGVAPATERFGARTAPAEVEPEPEPLPAPTVEPPRLRFEAGTGLRYSDTGAESMALRVSLGASWRPPVWGDRLELVLRAAIGTGRDAASDRFVGQFSDVTISAAARLPLPVGPALALVPEAGASLHVTEIDGVVSPDGAAAGAGRVNPSVDGIAALRWSATPTLDLGIFAGAHWLVRRQRYLAFGEPVFRLPAVEVEAGFSASFPFR